MLGKNCNPMSIPRSKPPLSLVVDGAPRGTSDRDLAAGLVAGEEWAVSETWRRFAPMVLVTAGASLDRSPKPKTSRRRSSGRSSSGRGRSANSRASGASSIPSPSGGCARSCAVASDATGSRSLVPSPPETPDLRSADLGIPRIVAAVRPVARSTGAARQAGVCPQTHGQHDGRGDCRDDGSVDLDSETGDGTCHGSAAPLDRGRFRPRHPRGEEAMGKADHGRPATHRLIRLLSALVELSRDAVKPPSEVQLESGLSELRRRMTDRPVAPRRLAASIAGRSDGGVAACGGDLGRAGPSEQLDDLIAGGRRSDRRRGGAGGRLSVRVGTRGHRCVLQRRKLVRPRARHPGPIARVSPETAPASPSRTARRRSRSRRTLTDAGRSRPDLSW